MRLRSICCPRRKTLISSCLQLLCLVILPLISANKIHDNNHINEMLLNNLRLEIDTFYDSYGNITSSTRKQSRPRRSSEGDGHISQYQDGEGMDAVMRRLSFTDSMNRLHSIMKIPELMKAQGYPSEIHKVVTEDGYILELHRIPGPRELDKVILPRRSSRKKRKHQKRETNLAHKVSKNNADQTWKSNLTAKLKLVDFNKNYPNNFNSALQNRISNLLNFSYNVSNTEANDYLTIFNLLEYMEPELLINENEILDILTEIHSKKKVKRSLGSDIFTKLGLTNPFRVLWSLALPFINKPPVPSRPNGNVGKQSSRLIKFTEPSPPRTKGAFFKSNSVSVDFSARQDSTVSSFFGASEGDSGASGKPVALLHHGIFSSSANFVLDDAEDALAYLLADAGYDVWMTNWRGNGYSRGHVTLDPDHADFWDFSLDEVMRYDVPAVFDYILAKTRQRDLYYVAHSLGCVMLWGATNYRPDLSDKVRVMAAMAPAAYMDHAESIMKFMALFTKNIYHLLEAAGIREMLVPNEKRTSLFNALCGPQNPLMGLCYSLLPLYFGEARGSHDPYYTDVFLSHFPSGTSSLRVFAQFGQSINAGGLRMFDFGPQENRRRYGRFRPPRYSLSNITFPVALMWGQSDAVTTPRDVASCARDLPNVFLNYRVPDTTFNHIDFFFSEQATDLVYKPILKILSKF